MMHAVQGTDALARRGRRGRGGKSLVVMTLLAVVGAFLIVAAPAAHAATQSSATQSSAIKPPVIIVTGLGGAAADYATLANRLSADGFTVDVFELPDRGNGPIHGSALALASRADAVLARTHSAKVELIGHSLGGLVARDYVRFAGGATKVDKVITLGTPNQGTWSANGLMILTMGCIGAPSCVQMAVGSTYLSQLNAPDAAVGDVRYWTFASKYDELVYPYQNAFVSSTSGHVVNTAVQDQCWGRTLGHIALTTDLTVYSGITQALTGSSFIWLNCWTPTVSAI